MQGKATLTISFGIEAFFKTTHIASLLGFRSLTADGLVNFNLKMRIEAGIQLTVPISQSIKEFMKYQPKSLGSNSFLPPLIFTTKSTNQYKSITNKFGKSVTETTHLSLHALVRFL